MRGVRLLAFLAAVIVRAGADSDACCQRSVQLDGEVKLLASRVDELSEELALLRAMIDPTKELPQQATGASSETASTLPEHGDKSTSRKLTAQPSTFVTTDPGHQVHEFTHGHSCSNLNGLLRVLPVVGGQVSFDPTITDSTSEQALVAVSADWSTVEIDKHVAPMKVVHDCQTAPTLSLPLNTVVEGTLTVDSVDLKATLIPTVCVRISTRSCGGSCPDDEGTLNVFTMAAGGGGAWVEKVGGTSIHATGAAVYEECINNFRAVAIANPTGNGWVGAVEGSLDGGNSWVDLICISGCEGPVASGALVVADLDASGGVSGATECINGQKCTFVTFA